MVILVPREKTERFKIPTFEPCGFRVRLKKERKTLWCRRNDFIPLAIKYRNRSGKRFLVRLIYLHVGTGSDVCEHIFEVFSRNTRADLAGKNDSCAAVLLYMRCLWWKRPLGLINQSGVPTRTRCTREEPAFVQSVFEIVFYELK